MLCEKCQAINFQFVDELLTSEQDVIKNSSFGDAYAWSSQGESHHYYYFIFQKSFTTLASSARLGCHLCTVIYTAFTGPDPWLGMKVVDVEQASREDAPIIMRIWSSKKRIPFAENVLVNERVYEEIQVWYRNSRRNFVIIEYLPEDLALPSHNLGRELLETGFCESDSMTGSPNSLLLLKAWLQRCEANHPQCRDLKATMLPTRIVDVGTFHGAMTPHVKISTSAQEGRYVALSHCWGDAEYLAEIRNWASDTTNLPPLDKWPKTFREAVEICKSLEISYLWIDTLCIDQKDPEDFAREGAKMAEYYTGATLVIAALHAKDSRDGCFAARNPLLVRPCPVRFQTIPEREFFLSLKLVEKKDDRASVEIIPLDTRAWVWQETLLARRSVNFHRQQLAWSCILNRAHESRPEGRNIEDMHPQFSPTAFLRTFIHHPQRSFPSAKLENEDEVMHQWRTRMFRSYNIYNQSYIAPDIPDPDNLPRDPAYQKWYDCVEKFTDRNISYATDALPALSGLAKKVHSGLASDNVYHAGLWSGDLVRGLLWAVFSGPFRRKKEDPMPYIAPSWSWASRIGERISYFFDETIMCEMNPNQKASSTSVRLSQLMKVLRPLDIHIETQAKYAAAAQYGEVTGGSLRCRAHLLHGGRVMPLLIHGGSSIYHRAHPAYHRGLGGTQKDDHINCWGLVLPAPWAVDHSLDKDGKERKKAIHDKSGPGEIMGELAFDGTLAPREAILEKDPRIKWAEVHVLLLWPFKFKGDRVIGLGLVKTGSQESGSDRDGNVYRRVGRVEFVIPHQQLWDHWQATRDAEDGGLEHFTIV